MTGVQTWSVTAANNVNANTGVNWDEGMSPGAVNNSARQVLSDVRSMANDLVWFQYGIGDGPVSHAYASATSTTVPGANVTAAYHVGRRVRAVGSSTGTIYGSIASSSYSAPNTTVNYTWDSGSLANESLVISISQVPVTGRTVPPAGIAGYPASSSVFLRGDGTWTAATPAVPTRQVLTSGSGATYTTPAGARQLRVRMVGGGGGSGAGAGSGNNAGGAGGNTIFNSVNAAGGSGGGPGNNLGNSNGGAGGTGGSGSASYRARGGPGQSGNVSSATNAGAMGAAGGCSLLGGGAVGPGVAGTANTGGGASSNNVGNASGDETGAGGGAGEYVELIINSPSATYTYTIGAGGPAGTGNTPGFAGGSGVIIVDEIY